MSKIVLATFGSLGDLHPMIALGLELKHRGHQVTFATMDFYREKIEMLGFEYVRMAPHVNPDDITEMPELVDAAKGTEKILREIIIANVRPMYDDLLAAVEGADVLITGEIIYAAKSVVEKTGIKWVTTTLAPISLFSTYDPPVPPTAIWFENLRFLGSTFHGLLFRLIRTSMRSWLDEYRTFRRSIGLDPDDDPIFRDKFSRDLHLIMFSRMLGAPQPDWPADAVQTGFCFYDGQADSGKMPDGLIKYLDAGEPPIVFTLGSAAVMDPRDFFVESLKAAKMLGRRAVLLYGVFGEHPPGLTDDIVGFDYAPYSLLFPRAACVVHQAGVGTTGQVLRAGVPHLIVPFAHDQPDNAARCRRLGVAEIISRDAYTAESAAKMLKQVLSDDSYRKRASEAASIVNSEGGTAAACDAIEAILS
ncbi:MAG: nucleotide disphospho-sugar-binding domain-containing protein [Acidobacteriota bacterium]